jgi:DNA primase
MSQIQQVKAAHDIVDVIGKRLTLQRSGTNFKAVCPFHGEKSPSFFVSPVLQRYRCFGCQKSGDVLTFLQEFDGMTFHEALKQLADEAGITLSDYRESPEDKLRGRVMEVLDLAARYYHYLLTDHAVGEPARVYLKERGVNHDSIRLFQIGFAPEGWDNLIKYLHGKKKYSMEEIEAAGLIVKGGRRGHYDRFRGRVTFPLTNHRGQVVGMSGRVLKAEAKEAKYINTPETLVYHKAELLFGLSHLYQEIRKAESVIVVEGELDVISSAQAHVNNIVAIKGSALTAAHVKLLERTVSKVLLALDSDEAGIKATKRAIEVAADSTLELRVVELVGGKDPDELARHQPGEWRRMVEGAVSVFDFLIHAAAKKHDSTSAEGKRKIMDELAPWLQRISHAVEQDVYIKKVARLLEVKEELVRSDVLKFGKRATLKLRDAPAPVEKEELSRRQRWERLGFFLVLSSSKEHQRPRAAALLELPKLSGELAHLLKLLQETSGDLSRQLSDLPADMAQLATDIWLDPEFQSLVEHPEDLSKEWQSTVTELKKLSTQEAVTELTTELEALDELEEKTPEEEAKQQELLKKIVLLQR